jgi:uncharacterized protein involved in exopolysaccharide biosynthesis
MLAENEAQLAQLERQYPALPLATAPSLTAAAEPPPAREAAPTPAPPGRPATRSAAQEAVASLEAKLASLRSQYTDQYPDVVAVQRQLAQAKVEQELEASRAAAQPVGPTASGRAIGGHETPARSSRRRTRAARLAAPPVLATAKWADLRRNHDVLRADYQQLLSRREATRMSRAVYENDRSGKYQVTRRPTVPIGPSGPKRPLYLALAALAAVGAGLGGAYLMAIVRGILVTPRELEQTFQLPVVGTVTLERAWQTRRSRGRLARRLRTRRLPAREQAS